MSVPATLDLTLLRPILDQYAPQGRAGLLPALHAAQAIYSYIAEPVAEAIGRALNVPLADVHGVIDFYALFYRAPVGRTVVRVCTDPACWTRGGETVLAEACRLAGCAEGETSADGALTVERSPCLGLCNTGPAVNLTFNEPAPARSQSFGHVTPDNLEDVLAGRGEPPEDYIGGDLCIVTSLCGRNRRMSLTEYHAVGGMQALRRVLGLTGGPRLAPLEVVDLVNRATLVGRGGAAFPTGVKWDGAAKAPNRPKYFVINADESEPGTFKDRVLIENDPCRIIEGAIIGAYAIGANRAYFYIRGEYPRAIERVLAALAECRRAGYLGENILGSGYDLEFEVRAGAGAYICGEETALFESIEGKRGFPRIKPPFPATHGLFGQPTAINNVETLAKIPYIITHGPTAFHQFGTERSTGPKLFCVSGDVARPGLYEVPFGVTIRHMLDDLAGGVIGGELGAILFGGASGAFADARHLEVKLSFEDMRAAGLPLGSGAIMVFNATRDRREVLRRLGRFFAHESCGKCYPCQLGTQRQHEVLERLADGRALAGDRARLQDVGWTMTDASLCGLGQTAASAVLSAMRLWPDLFPA
ncbi:MAG: NAD(P)H-dependent oxidoreductase subunit E [Anaerolineales bacterium]|nr:NAD(P)H-dependent oxidoreductase subunit E [Anaerolineales bacterium]